MKHVLLIVSTIASLMMIAQANASPITIISHNTEAYARDSSATIDSTSDNNTTFGSRTITATDGGSTSSTSINWTDTGTGALLDFGFDQTRTGASGGIAYSASSVSFTANTNTTYLLSGMYSAIPGGSIGQIYSDTFFTDDSTGLFFRDLNVSQNTVNESFILGVVGDPDSVEIYAGTLTLAGTLVAGHSYRFNFVNYIQAFPNVDSGGSAMGCFTLSIGGATGGGSCGTSVPAPAPLALFGLGLLALGIRRKYT